MDANTSTSLARSASTLAGSVFTTTTPALFLKTKAPAPHRFNKAELEERLFHAQFRAHVRRIRQSLLEQDLPTSGKPQRTTRAVVAPIPRDLPIITTTSGFAILAPTAVRPAHPSILNAPKLGPLPTPPATPEPETRPLLPTRRSRATPFQRPSGSRALNVFGEDPILTPNHVFPDNFRRTPGAGVTRAGKVGSDRSYFHLPPGLFETPAAELPTSTSTPPLAAPVGLGITVPNNVGWRNPTRRRAVVGLGMTGVDFEEEDRLDRCVVTIL